MAGGEQIVRCLSFWDNDDGDDDDDDDNDDYDIM
jgi:hypothetical protein